MPSDGFERFGKQPPAVGVDPFNDLFERPLRRRQIGVLVGKRFVSGFKLFQLIERFEVDIAEVVDLLPQLLDFLLHALPLVLLFIAGSMFQLGQLDAVIFAHAVGQGRAFVADFIGRELLSVDFILELADFGADFLNLGRQFRALGVKLLAPVDKSYGLRGVRFLANIKFSDLGFGVQDVPLRGTRPVCAFGQVLAAFVDCPIALLAIFV